MNRIRQSFDGIKNMVTNVIAFVAGDGDDSSLSSGEIVECDSDCSQCCSDNDSISMNSSNRHSSSDKRSSKEAQPLNESRCRNPKHNHPQLSRVDDLVQSLQNSSKRKKRNSDSSGNIEEESPEEAKKGEQELIEIKKPHN